MTRINGTVTDMLTVGPYQPIAGLGRNTIRKMKASYADLQIGDEVEMIYKDSPDSKEINGVERLKVSSIAMVPFSTLLVDGSIHLERNHACFNSEQEFIECMARCYGSFYGYDHFLVIYFA